MEKVTEKLALFQKDTRERERERERERNIVPKKQINICICRSIKVNDKVTLLDDLMMIVMPCSF
jgi:hypothetical protein